MWCIILKFCRWFLCEEGIIMPKSKCPFCRGKTFIASRSCPHSLAHVPLSLQSSNVSSLWHFSVITSPPWSQPEMFSSLKNPCNYTGLAQTIPDNLSISGSLILITNSESLCHIKWYNHRFPILRCGHLWGCHYLPIMLAIDFLALQPNFDDLGGFNISYYF